MRMCRSMSMPSRLRTVLLLALCWLSASAGAGEVVVVISADLPPYRQAQEALFSGIGAPTARALILDQVSRDPAQLPEDAACIVAIGTPAATWLHARKPTTALIYCMVSDPVGAGLHQPPLATGITTDVPFAEQMRLIGETLPETRTVGLFYRDGDERSRQTLAEARLALPTGWKLEALAIDRHDSPAAAIDTLLGRSVDVVWTLPDTAIWSEGTVRSLLLASLRRRVPVFGFSASFVRAGALLGVGLDPATQGAQAAALVRDMLAGKPPSSAVVPPIYEICLNLVVAQKLSLTLPPAVVERAKRVFQPGR
jgi:putative tryptophan/tyrosine transport system substrate-binding protein